MSMDGSGSRLFGESPARRRSTTTQLSSQSWARVTPGSMSHHSDDEDKYGGDDPESTVKKSERKRQREKQRRSDLASAFDELSSLLAKAENEGQPDEGKRGGRKRRSSVGDSSDVHSVEASGMTRLDIIGRTIETMRRLIQENSDLKNAVTAYRSRGPPGDENKEVLVMVPTLTPADGGDPRHPPPPPNAYPPYYPHSQPPAHGQPEYSSHYPPPYYSSAPGSSAPPGYAYGGPPPPPPHWNQQQGPPAPMPGPPYGHAPPQYHSPQRGPPPPPSGNS